MPRTHSVSLYAATWRYLKRCQCGKQLAPETLRWYRQKLEAFRVYMAREQHIASVGSVTALHVQMFLAGLPVSEATAHGYRRALHSFFTWCVQQGYARHNPAQAVRATWQESGGAHDGTS